MAHYGASKLDAVDEIHLSFSWPGTGDGLGIAAFKHGLHMWDGDCEQYLDGKWTDVKAGSGHEHLTYPSIGKTTITYCGHPESVTLPRRFPEVKNVKMKGGFFPEKINDVFLKFSELGLTSLKPIPVNGTEISPRDFSMAMFGVIEADIQKEMKDLNLPNLGSLRVEVTGKKNNQTEKYLYTVVDTPLKLTSSPAAIVMKMLMNGKIKRKGA